RTRQPFISSFCCPPNVARLVAESSNFAYGVADKAVWVHLYGASELATDVPGVGRGRLTQETDFPWGGRVKLTVGVERPADSAFPVGPAARPRPSTVPRQTTRLRRGVT